jgi:hypothetical protein
LTRHDGAASQKVSNAPDGIPQKCFFEKMKIPLAFYRKLC